MTNHPNRNRFTRWLNSCEGLSDDPLRRAAQIALAAIDEAISNDAIEGDDTGLTGAYEALCEVLSDAEAD